MALGDLLKVYMSLNQKRPHIEAMGVPVDGPSSGTMYVRGLVYKRTGR